MTTSRASLCSESNSLGHKDPGEFQFPFNCTNIACNALKNKQKKTL